MKLYPVKTRIIKEGDDLTEAILDALRSQNLLLEDRDVLTVTSKVVSYSERRLARLSEIAPSKKAQELGKRYSINPALAELILREADRIYGGVEKAVLTLKSDVLAPNAGVDAKNAPSDQVILWPADPKKSAKNLRVEIGQRTGRKVAILIVDSGLAPLRIGATGLALAVAGFKPIRDSRGSDDLYGKKIVMTRQAVADDLASAAHLLMGEAAEQTPVVVIRDAPVDFDDGAYDSADMMMPFEECIFMSTFLSHFRGWQPAKSR